MTKKNSKLADIVVNYVQLLPFLRRMGIELGFGDKTIGEVCEGKDLNSDFFIELMQLIIKKYDFNPKYIYNFEINLTIEYLRKSHYSYINEILPDIEVMIDEICKKEKSRVDDTAVLYSFFLSYKKDVHAHLNYEDTKIFPYIIEIDKRYRAKETGSDLTNLIRENTIKGYIKKHESLHEQLNDLKSLLIKYFHPFSDELLTHRLIKRLFELERDLKDHELIENQILFTQVYKMEQYFLSIKK